MRRNHRFLSSICLCLAMFAKAIFAEDGFFERRSYQPYVPSSDATVSDMLWISRVGKDDIVYDLGSGDGRVVIAAVRDFGAKKAVGIEIKPELVRKSREAAIKAGVQDRVTFLEGDLYSADFREATVVCLYLGHQDNLRLRPQLLRILQPGTRIVSHQFGMGEWVPQRRLVTNFPYIGMLGRAVVPFSKDPSVPDFTGDDGCPLSHNVVSSWVIPAPIAGKWKGEITLPEGPRQVELVISQSLTEGSATCQWSDTVRFKGGAMTVIGKNLELSCYHNKSDNFLSLIGQVQQDVLTGTLFVGHEKYQWKANRAKVDFTGTWEWSYFPGEKLSLRIEKREGVNVASFIEGDRVTPIPDFYDFGGGFAFTFLKDPFKRPEPDHASCGWFLGHAILEGETLKGSILFRKFPIHRFDDPGSLFEIENPPVSAPRDWTLRKIVP